MIKTIIDGNTSYSTITVSVVDKINLPVFVGVGDSFPLTFDFKFS